MKSAVATVVVVASLALNLPSAQAHAFPTPVQHVVVILQENHSFDNLLAPLCIEDARDCNASLVGQRADGVDVPLAPATDIVPPVDHQQRDQVAAIDGGAMDGWDRIGGCALDACYTAYEPNQIPSLAALARSGAISDAFYSRDIVPSWGGHIDFFAQTLDGFRGDNPAHHNKAVPKGPGWGCDSNKDAPWWNASTRKWVMEPACIPDQSGFGPYRESPVQYVPTVADRFDAAGRTWATYGSTGSKNDAAGYQWGMCPSFAECLYSSQRDNMHASNQLFSDAAAGTLANLSIVLPNGAAGKTSQHNGTSMIVGDNWIGQVVSAIQHGPDANSTTIFVYYDDCGCFYDHQAPPAGMGIRLPLVVISPYAKAGYTDHTIATNSSILSYAEHVLNVDPINALDANVYDLSDSFDYQQIPTAPFRFHPAQVPQSSIHYLAQHPAADDDT